MKVKTNATGPTMVRDETRDGQRQRRFMRMPVPRSSTRIPGEILPPVCSSRRVAGADMAAWASRRAISASSLPST